MPSPHLLLCLLLTVSFTLATQLGLWREQSEHQKARTGNVLEVLMGDSRRLFANHFFTKADAYLHSGVYPGIFDQSPRERKTHLSSAVSSSSSGSDRAEHAEHSHAHDHSGGGEAHDEEDAASGFLGQPRDWIEAFGRNFYPTRHTHLEKGNEREILPWLRLAAELNPNQVETYTVAAYWLRDRMGRAKDAEAFLREGWRANPGSFEIQFDLGKLYEQNYHDPGRARNLFEAALRNWQRSDAAKVERDDLSFMEITAHLARLEEKEGHLAQAIFYLEMLRKVSPSPGGVQKQIDALKERASIHP